MDDNIVKIALTGRQRSGKDLSADHLWLNHGFVHPIGFGDELKAQAHSLYPWIPRDPKPRSLYLFMDKMREFDKDVWVKHLEKSYHALARFRSTKGIVVKDLRQENEYEWCRSNGFYTIRITAPENLRKQRTEASGDDFKEEYLEHSTESYVDTFDVDYDIMNDGTIEELETKIDVIIRKIEEDDG